LEDTLLTDHLRAKALGVVLALALVSACDDDPSSPPPGPPECGGNSNLVNLSDPDSVLLQMQAGIERGFIAHYMNAFAQDFTFAPDPSDATQLPGAFDDWVFAVEEEVMGRVLADCVTRSLSFVDVDSTVVSDREVILREGYTLILGRDRYHGEAQFDLTRDQANDWRLTRWLDRRSASDPDTTWGILKGLYRQEAPSRDCTRFEHGEPPPGSTSPTRGWRASPDGEAPGCG
jgi:hypothetical protein